MTFFNMQTSNKTLTTSYSKLTGLLNSGGQLLLQNGGMTVSGNQTDNGIIEIAFVDKDAAAPTLVGHTIDFLQGLAIDPIWLSDVDIYAKAKTANTILVITAAEDRKKNVV